MQLQNWMIYVADLIIAAGAFTTWVWFMRKKYTNMIAPSKKHPYGQIVAEFWPESGRRAHLLLPIEANGFEVRMENKHECPRYFFNKEAQFTTQWPLDTFFRMLGISVDAPIVSWPLNCPEPISPYNTGKPVVTAEMLGNLVNEEFLAMGMVATKELAAAEEELRAANKNKLTKGMFFIGIGAAVLASLGAAALGYLIYTGLQAGGWF
jgi:hypothetical protein